MSHEPPSQEQLVGGLAHRMNNILTLFHGYVGMMLENEKLDAGTRANLAKIKEGATAATELMDRTHALVRPSKSVSREVDLPFLLDLLRPTCLALCGPKTKFAMLLPEEMPPILTDASRVKSALVEIVRNACDATAESGGTVRVELGYEPAPRLQEGALDDAVQWVAISVINDGPGIAATTASRMFEPFYTTRKRKQAAGLGLNVAADAVQRLGGMLTHTSRTGETRFSILLPVQVETAQGAALASGR